MLKPSIGFLPRNVRSSISGAVPPTYSCIRPGVSFAAFSSLGVDDVINTVRQLPDKSSAADPMPRSVMKQVVHLVAPYFTELFNRSLAAGHFPSEYKEAFITPIRQESRPGYNWCQFILTDLELVGCIEASWAHRCSPTDGLFIDCQPPSYIAMWFPTRLFDGSRRSCTDDLSATSLRPHNWRACQLTLAAHPIAHPV